MKIGFIGCGNMGSAMIGGILKNGVFEKGFLQDVRHDLWEILPG